MGTINLTPSTWSPAVATADAGAVSGSAAPEAFAPAASAESRTGDFHGIAWTYSPGVQELLTAVPAGAWAEPLAQGWQRVKQNARREVWRAVLQATPYYVKYYFNDSWQQRVRSLLREPACRAEWEGGVFARRAGLAAVRPVAYAERLARDGRACAVLVSAGIEPAQPLNDFWLQLQSDDDVRRRRRDVAQLCELLAEMIARAHQAGFEHLDMHAANILVQPVGPRTYRTVFVDLQSARRDVPLSDGAVVRNLAQLNQWFRRNSSVADRLRFLRAYLRWRNEYETAFEHGRALGLGFAGLVAALDAAARRHAWRLGAQRDRRSARTGRYFTRLRLPGGWRGVAVTACKHASDESRASQLVFAPRWWSQCLQQPLRWFSAANSTACKNSHSAQVCRAVLPHEGEALAVIIKRPRARNAWRWFAQLWPPSRGRRGWAIGHALLHRDIATARPLAMLERRWGPLVRDSLLITEALPGAVDLESHLRAEYGRRTPAEWRQLKNTLAELLAWHVRVFHERGFEHRDCKASNILVVPHDAPKLLWIDLDGVRRALWRVRPRRQRALARLYVSLGGLPGVTRTDCVRFLKTYYGGYGTAADAWRAEWPALAAASARKQQAKAARRAWKRAHYGRE